MIAATATHQSLIVVTGNVRDDHSFKVRLLNPLDPPPASATA